MVLDVANEALTGQAVLVTKNDFENERIFFHLSGKDWKIKFIPITLEILHLHLPSLALAGIRLSKMHERRARMYMPRKILWPPMFFS